MEDIPRLSNTILLPIVVQVYGFHEFHRESEKLKNKKFESPQRRKQQKKLSGKIYREIIITHTAWAHSEHSQTFEMEPFANMAKYFL